ncbi:hypothetical protein KUCAC02_010311, partial [Chaenocephalus aceratus]
DLKTKIEKEDTKRELLGNQSSLSESHCIRCLEPFKFLVNSRRQCLDCQLHVCKSCSLYNKKEHGWVCDPCHMARVLKIGTLEWYHENVRARFKRFGSAKVMRSLFKRLSGVHSGSLNYLEADGYAEHSMDAPESPCYKEMKKVKRRLTVDPFDFELGLDCFIESRGRPLQAPVSQDLMDGGGRESMLAEADMASVFHQILDEKRKGLDLRMAPQQDDLGYPESQTIPSRSMSQLSYSSCGSGSAWGPQGSSLLGPEDSEEDDQLYPLYQSHLGPCSHTSQESLNAPNAPPQDGRSITDLNSRVSAIENLLNHLEQNVTSTYHEEQQLRLKLHQMTDNISDHSLSSDEDEPSRPLSSQDIPAWRSHETDTKPTRIPTSPPSRSSILLCRLEEEQPQLTDSQKTPPLENGSQAGFRGSTALLVELEDKVAQAAANVQNAQSEVSYIENRIAALNAAGMPVDKRRRGPPLVLLEKSFSLPGVSASPEQQSRVSMEESAIPVQERRLSHHVPTSQVQRFVRNSLYRGSLTQRNPVAKPQTKATCASPCSQGPLSVIHSRERRLCHQSCTCRLLGFSLGESEAASQ